MNGLAGVLPLVGEHGGPDGGVDTVQDGFADGPNAVLGGVNQPALNSAGEGVLVVFYSNKSFVFCWYVNPIVEVVCPRYGRGLLCHLIHVALSGLSVVPRYVVLYKDTQTYTYTPG